MKKRSDAPPESVPKPRRTPPSRSLLTFRLSCSNDRISDSRSGSAARLASLRGRVAFCSGLRPLVKNGLSGAPPPRKQHAFLARKCRRDGHVLRFQGCDEVGGNILISHIVHDH